MASRPRPRDPVERLALLLRQAFIAAYCASNPTPHHPPPQWQEARYAGQSGWHQFARECLKLGLRADGEKCSLFADELARLVESMRAEQGKRDTWGTEREQRRELERQVDAAVLRVLHPEQYDPFGFNRPPAEERPT